MVWYGMVWYGMRLEYRQLVWNDIYVFVWVFFILFMIRTGIKAKQKTKNMG